MADKGNKSEDDDEEQLDPRIQLELEKLNAATDGINHLETEFGEAQALFQQMMQDATFQLKSLNQQLGKSVDKSRPYYEALKKAKQSHTMLHEIAVKFEQAQSRHYNAKKRVMEAEKRAFSSSNRKLDPALQEMLNQVTIEVMEASTASQLAWEIHRAASIEFEERQKAVQVLYKTLQKHIFKSRPYFDTKSTLNRQLEIQKQRLEKIQEGIQLSKNAYADTLHNLEAISDDIHRAREEKRRSTLRVLEPRGQGVGADSNQEEIAFAHSETMHNIRKMNLDNIKLDDMQGSDTESTDSEISVNDDTLLHSDTHFGSPNTSSSGSGSETNQQHSNSNVSIVITPISRSSSTDASSGGRSGEESISSSSTEEPTESNIKEVYERVDASYDVITSSSIPMTPLPMEILPDFGILDSGKQIIKQLRASKRARSYTDLSKDGRRGSIDLIDISKRPTDSDSNISSRSFRSRCDTAPANNRFARARKWNSFSSGINNNNSSNNSAAGTPETIQKALLRVTALTLSPTKDESENDSSDEGNLSN